MTTPAHIPVLYGELLGAVRKGLSGTGDAVVDMTLGLAGHARGILAELPAGSRFVGVDADMDNLAPARAAIESAKPAAKVDLCHGNFRGIGGYLDGLGVREISAASWDLGVSSAHYDIAERGFSFRFDGPLDMRFDRSSGITAEEILATNPAEELVRVFSEYGEERFSKTLAAMVVKDRPAKGKSAYSGTADFAAFLDRVTHDPKSKTRVFQALRMEANGELSAIRESVAAAFARLRSGGTLSVITFHSVEDRLVKRLFQGLTEAPVDELTGRDASPAPADKLTRKPVEPSEEEVLRNPRSRSAKLRVIVKR